MLFPEFCLNRMKNYSVSAKYPFTNAYNEHGITYASELWNQLKKDSIDIYQVIDEDILTTGQFSKMGKIGLLQKSFGILYLIG